MLMLDDSPLISSTRYNAQETSMPPAPAREEKPTMIPVPFEQLPQPVGVYLPSEIWLKIFALATFIPGAFELANTSAIVAFAQDTHGICHRSRSELSMDVKRALSLVDRRLHCFVQEFLFESVVIRSWNHAVQISAVLKKVVVKRKTRGWWTKRLEFALNSIQETTSSHEAALVAIFKACPNLVVLSAMFGDSFAWERDDIILPTLERCRTLPRIKRLEFKGTRTVLDSLVRAFSSSLEVLWIAPRGIAPSGTIHLPNLHTLIPSTTLRGQISNWDMPSLKTLWAVDLPNVDSEIRQSLLHLVVPTMDCLTFADQHIEELWVGNGENLLFCFVPPPYEMPRLRRITFNTRSLIWYECGDAPAFRSRLFSLSATNFPRLKTIRFTLPIATYEGRRDSGWNAIAGVWNDWLQACKANGVIVEISQGMQQRSADVWTRFPGCAFE